VARKVRAQGMVRALCWNGGSGRPLN